MQQKHSTNYTRIISIVVANMLLIANTVWWFQYSKQRYLLEMRLSPLKQQLAAALQHNIPDSMTINHYYEVITTSKSFHIEKLSQLSSFIHRYRDSLRRVLEQNQLLLSHYIDTSITDLEQLHKLADNFSWQHVPYHKVQKYTLLAERTSDLQLKQQLLQLVRIESQSYESILALDRNITSLIQFLKAWKNTQFKEFTQKDTISHISTIAHAYEALLQAQQKIDQKIYFFEELYNQRRTSISNKEFVLQLDPFYIEIQDYLYNKYVLQKHEYSTPFFSFKDKLMQTIEVVESCMRKINQMYQINEIFRKNTSYWDSITHQYQLVKQLCEKGKFLIQEDVRFHLEGNDSSAYHVSPMTELSSLNGGLQTGFEWAVIPIKSGLRSLKMEVSVSLLDSLNRSSIPVKIIKKVPVRIFRDKIWAVASKSKPRRTQEE
ncbi:MAG: hypothetical protein NZM38_03890 [Cytophagales bacterium]|nr:hypothetical protein [Cytophagales bacterium]MDW8383893.1 hypothetical protein [Flammeovirgaceae bacterium]